MKKKNDTVILDKSVRAMRKAVRNVIARKKESGGTLAICRDGKVVTISASKLR